MCIQSSFDQDFSVVGTLIFILLRYMSRSDLRHLGCTDS